MRYVSTRGGAEPQGFFDVLLGGLAPDGGLYLPERWPQLPPLDRLRGRPYAEVAAEVMWPFVAGEFERAEFDAARTLALICGPEVMMRHSAAALGDRGGAPSSVRMSMERNMKCGVGLCGHLSLIHI